MRIVHTADLHLGFKQYERTATGGINQRQLDVDAALRELIDTTIARAPQLVVIAGDVFHSVRPSNTVINHAFIQFARLVKALPGTPVVMVAGNHDSPRSIEMGSILPLFASLGIHVVDRDVQQLDFPALDLSVLAVPDVHGVMRKRKFAPSPAARFNVLVLHGEVQGMLPADMRHERAAVEIPTDEIAPASWDYVALGHYHVYRQLAPNMFYSGSIDYTSTNIWGELAEEQTAQRHGKGFAERDLVTGAQTFHALKGARDFVDLARISARGMTSDELNAALRERLEDGWLDDAVARLVVDDCPLDVTSMLDHAMLKTHKLRALNLQLEFRKVDALADVKRALSPGSKAPIVKRQVRSLDEIVRESITKRFADGLASADLSLDAMLALSQTYLDDANEKVVALGIPTSEASNG